MADLTAEQEEKLRSLCPIKSTPPFLLAILAYSMAIANGSSELTPDQKEKLNSLCQTKDQAALLYAILEQQMLIVNGSGPPPAGGITQLTGDVMAGPGSGSQAATVAKIAGMTVPGSITSGTFLYNNAGALAGATGLTIAAGALTVVTANTFTANGGDGVDIINSTAGSGIRLLPFASQLLCNDRAGNSLWAASGTVPWFNIQKSLGFGANTLSPDNLLSLTSANTFKFTDQAGTTVSIVFLKPPTSNPGPGILWNNLGVAAIGT